MTLYTERTKQDRWETAAGVQYNPPEQRKRDGSLTDTNPLYQPHNVPDSETEALMVCKPFDDPAWSHDITADLGNMIETFMNVLTPKEASVIELVVFGQMSLANAGMMLAQEYGRNTAYSKALVAKYRDSALTKMRAAANDSI